MVGSKGYQIRPLKRFESSFKKLVKTHHKKNKQALREFEILIEDFLQDLRTNPCGRGISDSETFPPKSYVDGFEFRKKR